ncbi:MAG TPA: DUF2283 domain-containing protein [Dongiaceae bacterium]|jgi:uncharacterized protein YuzE|nr:DUF2283 domain-containing protein [Dongiaceae bacterium]
MLRVTYDREVNAAYIYLTGSIEPGGVKETISATPEIYLDFDSKGCLIGIELLAGDKLHPLLAAMAQRPGGTK